MAKAKGRESWGLRVDGEGEGVWVCVVMHECEREGGGGGMIFDDCGGELGGVAAGVCVGVGVGVGMRVPVVSETSVGQLVPFCGVDVVSGVTGMATGRGFWVLVVWSSHNPPWVEMSLNSPLGHNRRDGLRSHSICNRCVDQRVAT